MRDLKKAKNPFKANFRIDKDEFQQFKLLCTLTHTTATDELVRFIRKYNKLNGFSLNVRPFNI